MILQFHSGLKDLCLTPVCSCTLKRIWTYRKGFRKQQLKSPDRNWSFFTSQMEEGAFKINIQAKDIKCWEVPEPLLLEAFRQTSARN